MSFNCFIYGVFITIKPHIGRSRYHFITGRACLGLRLSVGIAKYPLPGVIRLSVGIENIEKLKGQIGEALGKI